MSLVLTCICLNIEDNVNFKLGGVLIVCLIVWRTLCCFLLSSLETICFHLFKKKKKSENCLVCNDVFDLCYIHVLHCYLWEFGWTLNFGLKVISEFNHMNTWLFDWDIWTWSFIACFLVLNVTLVHLELSTSTLTCNLWGMKYASNCSEI